MGWRDDLTEKVGTAVGEVLDTGVDEAEIREVVEAAVDYEVERRGDAP